MTQPLVAILRQQILGAFQALRNFSLTSTRAKCSPIGGVAYRADDAVAVYQPISRRCDSAHLLG